MIFFLTYISDLIYTKNLKLNENYIKKKTFLKINLWKLWNRCKDDVGIFIKTKPRPKMFYPLTYFCLLIANDNFSVFSLIFFFFWLDAPVCKDRKDRVYGVSENETLLGKIWSFAENSNFLYKYLVTEFNDCELHRWTTYCWFK